MSEIPSYFTDFLHNIRLSDELTSELKKAHKDIHLFCLLFNIYFKRTIINFNTLYQSNLF